MVPKAAQLPAFLPTVKLAGPRHAFAALREHHLPIPCRMTVSAASVCDLWCAKQVMLDASTGSNGTLFADKTYLDAAWEDTLPKERDLTLLVPGKKAKTDVLRSGDCFSSAVSARRQPTESFFNWLQFKTNIRRASHIRALESLFFHIFENLSAAAAAGREYSFCLRQTSGSLGARAGRWSYASRFVFHFPARKNAAPTMAQGKGAGISAQQNPVKP